MLHCPSDVAYKRLNIKSNTYSEDFYKSDSEIAMKQLLYF